MKYKLIAILLAFAPMTLIAADKELMNEPPSFLQTISFDSTMIFFLTLLIGLLILFLVLISIYNSLYTSWYKVNVLSEQVSLWNRLTGAKKEKAAEEEEDDAMTEHVYDGIRELDNNLPLWWKYMFYATIIFSVVYLIRYHYGSGDLQLEEYNKELALAEVTKAEYRKKNAELVDETNVLMLADEKSLSQGKTIFTDNCRACHGPDAQGGVGPNLVDEYWLHGGGIKNIFKSIKYGIPEKGMISWQAQLKPVQIQQLSSYILSLKGTNPPNAKEPQGDLFKEQTETQTDSSATIEDKKVASIK